MSISLPGLNTAHKFVTLCFRVDLLFTYYMANRFVCYLRSPTWTKLSLILDTRLTFTGLDCLKLIRFSKYFAEFIDILIYLLIQQGYNQII